MIEHEPPDGSVVEFECGTDVYAAWRCDESSARAGWPTGDGGKVWVVYGESVPRTWTEINGRFGGCPSWYGVLLARRVADEEIRKSWPTQMYAETGVWPADGRCEPDAEWEDDYFRRVFSSSKWPQR